MEPIVCDSCPARFPVNALTEHDCDALRDQHFYQRFSDELRMLLKVQEFYRRHPQAEGRIKPHFTRILESDDPAVRHRLFAGEPFDQIELPPEPVPDAWLEGQDDQEIVEYLQHNDFDLRSRLKFVSGEVTRLSGSMRFVLCRECNAGRLYVPSENWDQFTEGDAITWHWPDWHSVDADGTLHVKASGWQGDCHWTGEHAVGPADPEYNFWRWLVDQEEYHRLVKQDELPAIREVWSRRTKRAT